MVLGVIDQLERVPSWRKSEKQVLGSNQNAAPAFARRDIRRPDLGKHVITAVGRRRAAVLLGPIRGQRINETEVSVGINISDNPPTLRQRSRGIARAGPRTFDENCFRWQFLGIGVTGKVAAALRGALNRAAQR